MRLLFFTVLLSFIIVLPTVVVAQQDFVPLVGIPFVDEFKIDESAPGLSGYVNSLYRAAIVVAAVLAVAKIVIAGVQYMLTDVATTKGQAKKTIRGAVFGLLLVIGAVLILETINPSLTSLNSLSGLEGITGTQGEVTISLPSGPSIEDEANRRFGEGGWKLQYCDLVRGITVSCKENCENEHNGIYVQKGVQFDAINYLTARNSGFWANLSFEGAHQCIVSNAADRALERETAAAVAARDEERVRDQIERQTGEEVAENGTIHTVALTADARNSLISEARDNRQNAAEVLEKRIEELKESAAVTCGVGIEEVAELLQPGGMGMTFSCIVN